MSTKTISPYLQGPFAPIDTEYTSFDLDVTGNLPPELDGRYLRNGPNPIAETDPANYHWFLGDGMVHGIRLRDGRAEWYRNRWVRSRNVSNVLGEEAKPGERHSDMDTANTNVIGHAGRTYAIVEAGARPVELSEELETICHTDLSGGLPHGYTAHPKRDPRTGELHAISYWWGRPDVVEYTVIDSAGAVTKRVDVPVPGGPMIHDCSITERYVVVYDLPVAFDVDAAMGGARFPYTWQPGRAARVGLLPRDGAVAELRWFEVEPCYVFHPLNAWDDGDRVVLDVVRHPKIFDVDRLGPNEGPPMLWRWTVDCSSGKVTEEQLDDQSLEFPRVDERRVGLPHRFGWGTAFGPPDGEAGLSHPIGLVRYDTRTGAREVVDFGPGRLPGELVFVPRSADAAEDDGWYMTIVSDLASGRGELVVLDAGAPGEGPVARVHLPTRVPMGFHGNWVPTGS
ncbi:MAG: carotenoid oxygenase family protein [Acidimicrobiales bacterium]|nr:carotenoid oxygenase family protein [Acidimicrobiales bacterium]